MCSQCDASKQPQMFRGATPIRSHSTVFHPFAPTRAVTWMTSSMSPVSSTPGTNPAPMPWILCGPGLPPDSTGDSAGSTATSCGAGGEHSVTHGAGGSKMSTQSHTMLQANEMSTQAPHGAAGRRNEHSVTHGAACSTRHMALGAAPSSVPPPPARRPRSAPRSALTLCCQAADRELPRGLASRGHLDVGVLLFEVAAGAGDGAARAHAADEDVELDRRQRQHHDGGVELLAD